MDVYFRNIIYYALYVIDFFCLLQYKVEYIYAK
jgi:hypothetical protein